MIWELHPCLIFLQNIEQKMLTAPIFYSQSSIQKLKYFFLASKIFHPKLRFTTEIENNQINFLEMVIKNSNFQPLKMIMLTNKGRTIAMIKKNGIIKDYIQSNKLTSSSKSTINIVFELYTL